MPAAILDHIGVVVSDIDRALEFWRDAIGLPVTGRGTANWPHLSDLNGLPDVTLDWCTLALDSRDSPESPDSPQSGAVIELTAYRGGRPAGPRASGEDAPGRAHVGIVVDDLGAVLARLRASRAQLRSDGPVRIAAGQYAGCRAIYALDPDGTSVELFERPAARERAR